MMNPLLLGVNIMELKQLACATLIMSSSSYLYAQPIWQDFSITGLYGEDYAVVDNQQTTITLEYAAKVPYADVFFFMDRMRGGDDHKSTYFELSPRFSLGEITGHSFAYGPIKDILISTTWESNNDDFSHFDNFLYGFAVDLNIPYFKYAALNFYRANNEKTKDDYQMTFVYGLPFNIKSEEFLVDGFLDWSTAEGDHASEMNWTTQYKWNVGKHISPKTRLYLGIEHSIWNNKFGLEGRDERNVSALIKYHF